MRRYLTQIACLVCFLPLVLNYSSFRVLWYFGDDWDQISEMARLGLWRWMLRPFAENVIPLYKLLWAGALHIFNGSYFALIVLIWITHVLSLLLLAKILRQCEAPPAATVCAVLTFGMPWSNIESLAWSTQWTGVLSSAAYLVAWLCVLRLAGGRGAAPRWAMPVYLAALVAAPLCHARGILNGLAIGGCLLVCKSFVRDRSVWALLCAGSFAAAAGVGAIYFIALPERGVVLHPGAFKQMAGFSLYYLALNPALHLLLLPVQQPGWSVVTLLGALKAAILARGFAVSSRKVRPFLLSLILLDLGYAAILGVGRFHTGPGAAVSSRYQYMSLLCFAPFLGMTLDDLLRRIGRRRARQVWTAAVLTAWALLLLWPWRREMAWWSRWRGSDIRQIVRYAPAQTTVPYSLTVAGRARQLTSLFNLN
jgi:hypothetical protein